MALLSIPSLLHSPAKLDAHCAALRTYSEAFRSLSVTCQGTCQDKKEANPWTQAL